MFTVIRTISRNFIRKPATFIINISGLSVSLMVVILLSVYSYSELTTDNFHENGDEVYLFRKSPDGIYCPGILTETIKNKIPGLKSTVRMAPAWETAVFQADQGEPVTSNLLFADTGFFKLFTYKSFQGDLRRSLEEPLSIALSSELATKIFGEKPAVGKTLVYNNGKTLTVSAVFSMPDKNSCLNVSAVTSTETRKILEPQAGEFVEWGWNNFQIFFLLDKEQNPDAIVKNLQLLLPEEEKKNYSKAYLTPLRDIYFSQFYLAGNNYLRQGNIKKVIALLSVALLVLVIALVNFVNITSAQWQERIKQTGIMKVVGAGRSLLIRNVVTESFLFFMVSLLIATQLAAVFSPVIQNYTGIQFNNNILSSAEFFSFSLIAVSLLSLLFSIIPAIKISSSKAIDNLRKTLKSQKKNFSANSFLVTLQFSIAITLIGFTILVQKQVSYGTNSLGMNQQNIIGIKLTPQLSRKKDVLRASLINVPAVENISFSQYYPGKPISSWGTELLVNGEKKRVSFDTFCADQEFYPILGLSLVSGRFYSDSLQTDRNKMIVNEAFLRKYNITDIAGASIFTFSGEKAEITGVIRDFHHKPVNVEIAPLVIRNDVPASVCMVKMKSENFRALEKSLADIRKITADLSPSFPVEVTFMDNAIQNMYDSELMFRRTFSLLSACAIIICCLGILAMSLSLCQRRVKEIGIRKVNGATVSEILMMLNRDFIRWVMVAFVISTPVALYVMHLWLRSYAYKTKVSWWIFVISGLTALAIALVTVSWQSLRAATRNPVEALRYE